MTITFRWPTGHIEMDAESILNVNPTKLKKLVSVAEENSAEVTEQIAGFLRDRIDELDDTLISHKKRIAEYSKLLDVVESRKPSKQEKAIVRMMRKNAPPHFNGAFVDGGKQCFSDGYRLIRLATPIPFCSRPKTLDAGNVIGDTAEYSVKLELPTAKELKQAIKLAKHGVDSGRIHTLTSFKQKTYFYDFGCGLPHVNPAFLLEMLECLPNCAAFCKPCQTLSPIYFISGDDDGILMPLRKDHEWSEVHAAS